MNNIIQSLKNIRKQGYLKATYQHQYAFVGIGNHSINNLYPVINYLRIPLKYIVTRSAKNAETIDRNFCNVKATTDLDMVLNDVDIQGVFICTQPEQHARLAKKVLESGKNVFVEKPPCASQQELNELIAVEQQSKGFCLTGLQKRYSPYYEELKKKAKHVNSYNLRYATGHYPEGDALLDLFIHPIDIVCYLFGEGKVCSVQHSKNKKTLLLHIQHQHTIGSLELSTDYSWNMPKEEIIANTDSGIYTMRNCETLTFEKKNGAFCGIPKEKIMDSIPLTYTLLDRSGFNPIFANNQIYASGFFNEINVFVKLCEQKAAKNRSALNTLNATYQIISEIKKMIS